MKSAKIKYLHKVIVKIVVGKFIVSLPDTLCVYILPTSGLTSSIHLALK